MKIIPCVQGESEWFQARLGKITASVFSKVMTPTGKLSASAEDVVNRAAAELIMGFPDDFFISDDMIRGQELEVEARDFINFTGGYNFKEIGFVDSEKGYGCSPDGVDSGMGLEIKCPQPHNHLSYLAGGVLPRNYTLQVQGSMLVTELPKWVFASYHPDFPLFTIEVERDEEIIKKLEEILNKICPQVTEKYNYLCKIMGRE